jgi:hypothetical protein
VATARLRPSAERRLQVSCCLRLSSCSNDTPEFSVLICCFCMDLQNG